MPVHPFTRCRRLFRKLTVPNDLPFAALQSVLLQGAAVLINLFTAVVTARALGAEGRGVYAAATTWGMLLGGAATIGVADAVLIRIRARPESSRAATLFGLLVALFLATALSIVAFILMPVLLGPQAPLALDLARAGLVFAHLGAVGTILRQAYAGQRHYVGANLAGFLPTALHGLLVAALLLTGGLGIATAVASVALGAALALAILLPALLRELQGTLHDFRRTAKEITDFAKRAALADLFALCASWIDKLVLIYLVTPAQLGLYVVAANLADRVTILTPKTSLLLAAMSSEPPERTAQLHGLALRLTLMTYLPVVAVLFVIDRLLITTVFGAGFAQSVLIFKLLLVQVVLGRLGTISSQFYLSLGRPALNSAIRGAELAVVVVAICLLAPQHGALGAAYGLLAGSAVRLALGWIGIVTHLRSPLPRLWLTRADVAGMAAMLKAGR